MLSPGSTELRLLDCKGRRERQRGRDREGEREREREREKGSEGERRTAGDGWDGIVVENI
jgi:hypothetical protein